MREYFKPSLEIAIRYGISSMCENDLFIYHLGMLKNLNIKDYEIMQSGWVRFLWLSKVWVSDAPTLYTMWCKYLVHGYEQLHLLYSMGVIT